MQYSRTSSPTPQHLPADSRHQTPAADHRPPSRIRRALPPLAVGVLGMTGLALAPAQATHFQPLYALEIFAADHEVVTTAACRARARVPEMAPPATLPEGTTASVVVTGAFQRISGRGPCRTWWIGGVPVAVQSGTRLPENRPPRGRLLRAVTASTLTDTPKLVAEKIVDRKRGAFGAASLEVAYVNTFVVESGDTAAELPVAGCTRIEQPDSWTVRVEGDEEEHPVTLDVTAAREGQEIEPCLGMRGDTVMAEFVMELEEEEE